MKSPLVDALRKANENGGSGDDTDTLLVDSLAHDAELTANEDYPESVLELADDAVPPAGDDSDPDPLAESPADSQFEAVPEDPEDKSSPTALSASRALTATQVLRQTSLAVEAPPLPLTDRQTLTPLMRIGRFSPLVCIALAAVSAGLFLAWLSFGGAYQNSELRALPSQVTSVDTEIARFEAAANPFRLIVDKPVESNDGESESP